MKKLKELILYRPGEEELLGRFAALLLDLENMAAEKEAAGEDGFVTVYEENDIQNQYFGCMQELIEIGESHGFSGNLWPLNISYLISDLRLNYMVL